MAAWAEEAPDAVDAEPDAVDADPRLCTHQPPEDVEAHEQDAVLALAVYRVCSGLLQEMEADVGACVPPTDEAVEQAVAAFMVRVPREQRHRGCAGCGMVVPGDDVVVRDVGSMSSLAMGGQRLAEHVALSDAGKAARHAILVDGAWFAAAPELCHTAGNGTLRGWFCKACVACKSRHTTFLSFDYGVPCAGLTAMSVLNKLALSRVLTHAVIVKLVTTKSSGGMRGLRSHCFAVPHDGAAVVGGMLNDGARHAVSVVFIGRDPAAWMAVRRRGLAQVAVDPVTSVRALHHWISGGHPLYQGLAISSLNLRDVSTALEAMRSHVLDGVEVRTDSLLVALEERMERAGDGTSGLVQPSGNSERGDGDALRAVARMVAPIRVEEAAAAEPPPPGQASVSGDLLNEFSQQDVIYGGGFPWLFQCGVPEEYKCGVFPEHLRRRLLQSYLGAFETDAHFTFHMFNQQLRHHACSSVATAAKRGKYNWKRFQEVVDEPGFDTALDAAVANPSGKEAAAVLKAILPVVRTTAGAVPWGPVERRQELPKFLSALHRFGPPSFFITFSRLSATDPLVVYLAKGDLDEPPVEVWNAAGWKTRMQIADGHPATCAARFDGVCKAVMEELCGVSLDAKKESLPKRRGLFGVVRAVKGVAEAQARGELHLHWLVWAMFGPLFCGRWVHTGEGLARIRDYLDRVVSGMAPVTEEDAESAAAARDAYPAACGVSAADIAAEGGVEAGKKNKHEHRSRCRKGVAGQKQCAMAMGKAAAECTELEQIVVQEGVDCDDDGERVHVFLNRGMRLGRRHGNDQPCPGDVRRCPWPCSPIWGWGVWWHTAGCLFEPWDEARSVSWQ